MILYICDTVLFDVLFSQFQLRSCCVLCSLVLNVWNNYDGENNYIGNLTKMTQEIWLILRVCETKSPSNLVMFIICQLQCDCSDGSGQRESHTLEDKLVVPLFSGAFSDLGIAVTRLVWKSNNRMTMRTVQYRCTCAEQHFMSSGMIKVKTLKFNVS